LKGEACIPVKAYTTEEYADKADVIFVCVKGYSIASVGEIIRKAAHKDTVVIPTLNVYGMGDRIQQLAGDVSVLDGCIYIVSYVSGDGEITQMGKIFRLVFGARRGQQVDAGILDDIRADLEQSGIKAVVSDDIDRDTFIKWSYISAMACTGAYFDVPMQEIQQPGQARDLFIGLSRESEEIGRRMGIALPEGLLNIHLQVLDKLDPQSTASLQKDLAKGHASEIDGLLFQMIRMGEKWGMEMPVYRKIALKFA
jgi:2-dehydropantoate 2-reductase